MKLRSKLSLGIGILFTLILIQGIQSIRYVRHLSVSSKEILSDNYNSVHYVSEMLRSLDRFSQDSASRRTLIEALTLQQQNITEINERQVTSALEEKVGRLNDSISGEEVQQIRNDLYRIMELNMGSILAKSRGMESSADEAVRWISVIAILCVLLAALFLLYFPSIVLRPIDKLKQGIVQIANHNYDQRLDFGNNRELRGVAESFNNMAQKLSQYRRSSLDRLMTEKMRIEAIVNSLHEPIIGLDSERNILFMNDEAFSILNLKRGNVIGRNAAEIAINNDLLRRLIRELYSSRESDGPHEPLKIYADNKESYFQMDNIPLYTNAVGEQERNFIGNLIILNNVTKYKELDSAKTNFISTVSHEMKTPISSILMSLQLLGDARLGSLNDGEAARRQHQGKQRPSARHYGRAAEPDSGGVGQAPAPSEDRQADRADRLCGQGHPCAGRTFPLLCGSGVSGKNIETVRRQREDRVGRYQSAIQRDPPLARKCPYHRGRQAA